MYYKFQGNQRGVDSSNSVRRPKSNDTKSKDRVLKNYNDKRPSAHVQKMSSSVSIDSNKRKIMHLNVCQSNTSVLSTKIVNAVNDGSNIVFVSCGKDVFLLSHEKCVARYALSRNSSVKRALFTTSIAAKSKNLGATPVVSKSRLSIAKTTTTINKKRKPKADIGIFIGYSKLSRGFCIYNHRTKKIMETIQVKFDELTPMSSECNNSKPRINCTNFHDSSKDSQSVPSKTDLDNLFGPLYEEYYATSSPKVSNNSAANTLDNDNTSSSSSFVVEEDEAPQIVSSSAEQVATESNSPILNEKPMN
nr:hypothetical protein [Tanacetum cinerariifolium]